MNKLLEQLDMFPNMDRRAEVKAFRKGGQYAYSFYIIINDSTAQKEIIKTTKAKIKEINKGRRKIKYIQIKGKDINI